MKALSVDRTTMPIESEIKVFEDRIVSGEWRVEYFDGDGGCYSRSSPGQQRSNVRETTATRSGPVD